MQPRASGDVIAFHRGVRDLCIDRLRDALDPGTTLFSRQLRNRRWEEALDTEDLTSTAICLVGLHRGAVEPARVGLDPLRTLAALADVTRRRGYAGGLGLVVWANAVWGGAPLPALLDRAGIGLGKPDDLVARLTTMETAWLATGLVHDMARGASDLARNALVSAVRELRSRQRDSGLFAHASPRGQVGHRLRRWVANFADQIYSVQALALAGDAGIDPGAIGAAGAAARRLVELQGSLGQWWWHYDPRGGTVAGRFPVYSVHQHAMAPMALMTLEAVGGGRFGPAIDLSHAWLARNELGVEMLDRQAGTVWRDIEIDEAPADRLLRHAKTLMLGGGPEGGSHLALRVNHETRPYEWAWCLFAGALAAGEAREGHAV